MCHSRTHKNGKRGKIWQKVVLKLFVLSPMSKPGNSRTSLDIDRSSRVDDSEHRVPNGVLKEQTERVLVTISTGGGKTVKHNHQFLRELFPYVTEND